MLYLEELAADDPRAIWLEGREHGLSSGIDEVFHFFFDDHEFDEADIGVVLLDLSEVAAIADVKRALEAVLEEIGDQGDDEFVRHPLWPRVREAAASARTRLGDAS
jgi:predicted metal-dependent phosphoesterase TrpH